MEWCIYFMFYVIMYNLWGQLVALVVGKCSWPYNFDPGAQILMVGYCSALVQLLCLVPFRSTVIIWIFLQDWPICVSYGAIAGYLVGMVVALGVVLFQIYLRHVKATRTLIMENSILVLLEVAINAHIDRLSCIQLTKGIAELMCSNSFR